MIKDASTSAIAKFRFLVGARELWMMTHISAAQHLDVDTKLLTHTNKSIFESRCWMVAGVHVVRAGDMRRPRGFQGFSEISCTEAVCHDGTPMSTAGVQQVLRLFTVS